MKLRLPFSKKKVHTWPPTVNQGFVSNPDTVSPINHVQSKYFCYAEIWISEVHSHVTCKFTAFAWHFSKWNACHYITPQIFTLPPSKNRFPTWSRWQKNGTLPNLAPFSIFCDQYRIPLVVSSGEVELKNWRLTGQKYQNQAKSSEVDGRWLPKRCIQWRHCRQSQSPKEYWCVSKICTQRRLCPQCTLQNQGCRCFPETRTQQSPGSQCSSLNQEWWPFPKTHTLQKQRF